MNPIKKLNEKVDWFISCVMKNEKSSNVELLVFFGLACFCLGMIFTCLIDVLNTFHEEPVRTILGFVSWAFMGYIMFRLIFGKNQIVSEILKRMNKEW